MISLIDSSALSKTIGYNFQDPNLLLTALTHKSALKRVTNAHGANNERLEFLGDAVLSVVAANYLYQQSDHLNEGALSRLRAQFICEDNLSLAAKRIGLGDFIHSDKAMRASGSNNSKAILADAMEAIFGAVFLDGGLKASEEVIFNVLGFPSCDVLESEKDFKTRLQEMVQANIQSAPQYVVLETSGPAHAPTFLVGVKIKESIVATGSGENKRRAAQNAASNALEMFSATHV
jgi:ribonuclease-3